MAARDNIKDAAYWTENALEAWARSMRGDSLPDGYPSQSVGMENYTTLDADSERAYSKLDAWLAEVTDAVVCSLAPPQQCVLRHAYGLIARVEFFRYASTLVDAKLCVQEALRRRGVWMGD